MKRIVKRTLIIAPLVLILLFVALIARDIFSDKELPPPPPLYTLEPDQVDKLIVHLNQLGMPPEQYVVGKFRKHDIIMLGEYHRIRHDPLFVQRLIPLVYEAGVRLLGYEWAFSVDQDRIDSLLNGKDYNEFLAIDILRRPGGFWPYREYLDILKAAWSLNSTLPHDVQRFQIVGLAPYVDFEKLNYGTEEEQKIQRQQLAPGVGDEHYASVIEEMSIRKGKKILAYLGTNHAFTRFRQPRPKGQFSENRAGQILARKYPGKVITVLLHEPVWNPNQWVFGFPFGGAIDVAFSEYKKPVGFDVLGSPFASLTDSTSDYSQNGPYTLHDFSDGYLILNVLGKCEPATIIDEWLDGVSFSDFKRRLPKKAPWFIVHPRIFLWTLEHDSKSMSRMFKNLATQLTQHTINTGGTSHNTPNNDAPSVDRK